MANDQSKRLGILLELRNKATMAAYQQWMVARDQFERHQIKHKQLVHFREDYLIELGAIGEQGSAISRLRNRIDFINHLDMALQQINQQLAQLAKQRQQFELHYKQKKSEEEAVTRLIDRVQEAARMKQDRLDQKEIDEYGQKQWYSRENHKR